MDLLHLLLALLLPWLGSFLWLRAIEGKFNSTPAHPLRQLGYAYFIGLLIVYGLLTAQSRLTGQVSFWPIMGLLAVFAISGLVFRLFTTVTPFPAEQPQPRLYRSLFYFFLSLIGIHLALVAIEIWYRPIFPWDAWQTWMYRSKAWFFAGNILPMDSATSWERGVASAPYNTYGAGYPAFVSVIGLWSSLALGEWRETLVNLPTLFCGIALALGLYGHCREAELPRWMSALGAYLFLSIPLIGSHLALAGQADIWQAAFTGLGFTSLVLGIVRGELKFRLMGLGTLLLGALVKNEGIVWFLAGVTVLIISHRARLALTVAAAVLVLAGLAWVSGIHYLDIPGAGGLGVVDGFIHIPFLGKHELMIFSLWDDYQANFFESSTWHMLWWLVIVCALCLPMLQSGQVRWATLSLLLVFIVTQAIIFAFTSQGRWAEDWTAINRLPLHTVPALIFCLLLCARQFALERSPDRRTGYGWLAPALGLLLCGVLAIAYMAIRFPSTSGHPISFTANNLSFVAGGGQIENGKAVIDEFENNIAVISSRRFRIDTSYLKMLHIHTGGENRAERRFFWRNGYRPEDLHSIDIGETGKKIIHLDNSENWQRKASEVGLLLYEDESRPIEIYSVSLQPRTMQDLLALTWQDWTTMTDWSSKSVHYVPAGAESSPLKLPIVLAVWLFASFTVAALLARLGAAPIAAVAGCIIAAWLVLDLRWISDRWDQSAKTRTYYTKYARDHLDIATDVELAEFTKAVNLQSIEPSESMLIVSEDDDLDFEALRLKYHLLPQAAHYRKGSSLEAPSSRGKDTVVIVRQPYLPPGEKAAPAADFAEQLGKRYNREYRVVLDTENGVLLTAVERPAES